MKKKDLLEQLEQLENCTAVEIAKFWDKHVAGKSPLIEVANDKENNGYFFWRGDDAIETVFLLTGATGDKLTKLTRIKNTHYFYVKLKLPNKLRTLYSFLINVDLNDVPDVSQDDKLTANTKLSDFFRSYLVPDPMNKQQQSLYDGDDNKYTTKSVIEMPAADPQPWSRISSRALAGKIIQQVIKSNILGEDRTIWIYTPAGYNPDEDYGLVLQYDGQLHQFPSIPMPIILDNLTHAQKIKPKLTVFVDSVGFTSRNDDFINNAENFAKFIQDELLPWVGNHYKISKDPSDHIVSGESAAGFFALYTGLLNSEFFGNILCNSPTVLISSAMKDGILERLITNNAIKNKIYMSNGSFEDQELMLEPVNQIYQLLQKNNYDVIYNIYCGEHDFVCWQGEIAKGMIHLMSEAST